jgi:hypothetical protein
MPLKTATCPSCGAPVEFHAGASVLLVCGFCRSTLLRSEEKLENLGRMAELLEDFSSIRLGTQGVYRGVHFGVIGRIQLRYSAGVWNEWYILFDDARTGWLSDANGDYTVSFVEPSPPELPTFEALAPGETVTLGKTSFSVTNREEGMCIAGEGELPFKVGSGYPAPVVDARFGSIFATIDYSETPPLVFIGESVSRESLALTELKESTPGSGPTETGLRAFDCPTCGAAIELCSTAIQRVACTGCGSLLDAEDRRLNLVERAHNQLNITPTLAIGSKGRLRNVEYEVIGFLRRRTEIEGVPYHWDEYLLFDPRGEFRWLSCSEGHWNFVTVLTRPPASGKSVTMGSVSYDKENFKHFQTCTARVTFVLGAFNWRVSVGESAQIGDYVAPPRMLSIEKTANEVSWSLGEYLNADELTQAFKLAKPLPRSIGVYANQPNPNTQGFQKTLSLSWKLLAAGFVLHLVMLMFSIGSTLNDEMFTFGSGEQTLVGKPFELTKQTNTLRVENESDLDNAWVDLNMQMVNEKTGEAWQATRGISFYSGTDSDGSWTEGSKSDDVVFLDLPPGTYHLTIDTEAGNELASRPPATLRTNISRAGAVWSNFILLALFLAIFPVWAWSRQASFEKKRWMESDHPPVTDDD